VKIPVLIMASLRDEIQKAYEIHHGTPSSSLQGSGLGANRVVMVGAGRLPHHMRKHRHHFTRVVRETGGHKGEQKHHHGHGKKKDRSKAEVSDAVARAMEILKKE